MTNNITKIVFPVAGLGTKLYPITKSIPKEMLPVIDKPLIQYAIEEAINAGFKNLIFIINEHNSLIKHYLTSNTHLSSILTLRGKQELNHFTNEIFPNNVSYSFVEQPQPLGLGHAVLMSRKIIGDEPFAVALVDELMGMENNQGCLAQLVKEFEKCKASIVSVSQVPRNEINQYGIVWTEFPLNKVSIVKKIIEKPESNQIDSDLAITGRYIFMPTIFDHLQNLAPGVNNEIQLTDAIDLLSKSELLYAYCFEGKRYDCGKKLNYLKAIIDYGINHLNYGDELKKHINNLLSGKNHT